MAKANRRSEIVRYLLAQACLSVAVGPVIGVLLAVNVNGLRSILWTASPVDVVILLGSAVIAFFPVVMATSIWLLAWERSD
jgi:hypothetical protein